MRKWIALSLLLVALITVGAWIAGGCPPARLILRYGLTPGCDPTGQTRTVEGIVFVEIGPGCFRMGSDLGAAGGDFLGKLCARLGLPWGDRPVPSDEMPVHWVEFPRGFWIARTEVTNAQYEAFRPEHARSEYTPGNRDPVVDVPWEDAKKYCAWLSKQSGLSIRLPSESEWECACRAGSRSEFSFGDDEKLIDEYAWYDANYDIRAHEVETLRANAWGLHDFHGNVWEWCEDTYHENYEGAPADGTAWTEDGEVFLGSPILVIRGGSFRYTTEYCRSALRYWSMPVDLDGDLGFRPAFTLPPDDE